MSFELPVSARRSDDVAIGDIVIMDGEVSRLLIVTGIKPATERSERGPFIEMSFWPEPGVRSPKGSPLTKGPQAQYDVGSRLHGSHLIELKVRWEFAFGRFRHSERQDLNRRMRRLQAQPW